MARTKKNLSPTYSELIEPVFKALVCLGGSGTNNEIYEAVIKMLQLPDRVLDEPHKKKTGSQTTELEYQLAWARTYLKWYGAIVNRSRAVWMITPEFAEKKEIDAKEVLNFSYNMKKKTGLDSFREQIAEDSNPENDGSDLPEEIEPWKEELSEILHALNPYAFERLAQLLLRECGFTQVSVTKKSGDGGIDGTGKLRINGIFSFNVAFQCKRYSGSVSAGDIRDFRGSLTTDIEKGIFITTGTFTRAAREEASNTGKQQIDLIDGEEFINMFLQYRLGVHEKTVFEVDREFFEKI